MKKKSLVTTITMGSVGLIVCAFLIALIIVYIYASTITQKTHDDHLEQQLNLLSKNLKSPLWSLDEHSIKLIGDAYMAGVESASLVITASHSPTAIYAQKKPSSKVAIYRTKDIVYNDEVIGTVQIGLSSQRHDEELLRLMGYSVSLACLIIVTLIIAVKVLIRRNMVFPLSRLGDWTDSIASGDYLSEPPRIEHEELSSLADKFQNMSSKILNREQELVKLRDNLQLLVDEQTKKLKDAQVELLQRERLVTLGELTATVSHELRNPLGTIKTSLFTISESLKEHERSKVTRSLELADRSIDRCVTIIEELNSYAREKKLECSETDIDKWLVGVLEEMGLPEEIDCELDISSQARALIDPEKLRQVIVNLVNNAVDALQDENSPGSKVQVSTRLLDDFYEISVSDNGCGMTEEVKQKLFEPLFSTKGFGVGLGMVIVKNIVDRHNGEILVESQVSSGTKITIRLPLLFACD